MRPVALAGILASTTILSGCAATVGGISLSSISSFAGFASTIFTGADLGEHAASLISGKDCRFSEGLMREDRDVCEEPGSLATRDDFHGIFVERIDEDGTVIYAAPKYMPASVGAGENENNPDVIWAQIKAQKAVEEDERQLARAQASQTINVASLSTVYLPSQSLSFMPAGTAADADIADGDTASQTASTSRPVVNAAKTPAAPGNVQAPAVDVPIDTNQPAIDEKSFTMPIQPAAATGSGGPFIATSASSMPVASTLINGEPVVVLRIGPMFATNAPTSAQAASAVDSSATDVAANGFSARPSGPPSPQAILSLSEAASEPVEVASVEPQMMAARPRTKPSPSALVAEVAKPKAARLAPAVSVAPVRTAAVEPQPDVYQPPAISDLAYDEIQAATSSMRTSGDSQDEHKAIPVTVPTVQQDSAADVPPATSGPAPLVQLPQE